MEGILTNPPFPAGRTGERPAGFQGAPAGRGVVLAQKEIVHHLLRATSVVREIQGVAVVTQHNWTIFAKPSFDARVQALARKRPGACAATGEGTEF